jgi:hypothetical protein
MHKRGAVLVVAFGVLGLALLLFGGLASAAGTQAGGAIHVFEVSNSPTNPIATDVITGAITDHGIDHEGANGINTIALSKGSFKVDTTRIGGGAPAVDGKTCSFTASFRGPAKIVKNSGKGAYKGISGTFSVSITEAGILPRLKNGKCNESQNANPVAAVSFVKANGTVSFK